jgi:serine/threonine protein kinase
VDSNGVCKLTDFGCSKKNPQFQDILNKSLIGTVNWMAPEMIKQKGHSNKVDIWALGCTFIEMATAKPPYNHITNPVKLIILF